jgi:hypothetical protein
MNALSRISSLVPLALAGLSIACGDASSEPVAQTEEALTPITCSSTVTSRCWEPRANIQAGAYAYFPYEYKRVVFADAKAPKNIFMNTLGGPPVGYKSHPQGLPSNTRWLTILTPYGDDATIWILGEDSKVRVSNGVVGKNIGVDDNFSTVTTLADPISTTGATLCLREIEAVRIPGLHVLGLTVVARSCDGKLYRYVSGKWKPAADDAALSGLPNTTYSSVSSLSTTGATFLTQGGDFWRAMTGTVSRSGTITYDAPVKANRLQVDGVYLQVHPIGGKYVLTNAGDGTCEIGSCSGDADRIYSYDFSSGRWTRFNRGLPWYPTSVSDLGECSRIPSLACDPEGSLPTGCGTCYAKYPYFYDIADFGSGLALQHRSSWLFRYRP